VDIIIGTHRLLGKDIEFNNLGLLIIDEEQKFGVASKERLKAFKVNVDTLTLTATPIPRTLHFSLMGARDLSIINTPPLNRQPVKTELHIFDKDMLKNAIDYELKRGGQVFVVHNRVKDIASLAGDIRSVCPEARVAIAHGQMQGDELENVMIGFVEGEYDVLVATTIIESGLDIPNANTIIINNAHYFGLSDLHQMRGRVGRSNKKAYCYLFCPSLHTLSEDARRRLIAIEEFSELGSGFNVAMRDLDIRGAGNLLGGEQSGFIAEIGFDMYHKILDEAIEELKLDEFSEVFADDQTYKKQKECLLDTDLDAMIPDEFVRNISERLSLYSELARLKTPEQLVAYKIGLRDRFGPLPRQVERLLDSVKLKWLGEQTGFEKINFKNSKLSGTFITDDAFFKSDAFSHIIQVIQQHPGSYALKQNRHQLMLICEGVDDVKEAINLLGKLNVLGNLEQTTLSIAAED
jgi:transcription-repair coupling factor (superfamily II helicase)